MTEPGGHIQWDESDLGGIVVDSPNQNIPHTALDEMRDKAVQVLMTSKGSNFR